MPLSAAASAREPVVAVAAPGVIVARAGVDRVVSWPAVDAVPGAERADRVVARLALAERRLAADSRDDDRPRGGEHLARQREGVVTGLDAVVANAGVGAYGPFLELDPEHVEDMIDVNLTGVWNTCKVALPHLIDGGRGGAIVLTSSTAGLKGTPRCSQ